MKHFTVARGLAALVVGTLAAMAPLAAHAEAPLEQDSATVATTPTGSWIDNQGYVRLSLDELNELAETQSPADVEHVLASGGPVNLLLDESNEVLAAAVAEKAAFAPRAISTCFSGGAIIKRYIGVKSSTHCYTGVGTLDVNLPSVYYLAPAGYNISMYVSGGSIPSSTVSWNTSSVTYKTPLNVYKLQRWAKAS